MYRMNSNSTGIMLVLWYYIAGLLTQVSYGSILSYFSLEQTFR